MKAICFGTRLYERACDRYNAVRDFRRLGFNYFVGFMDADRTHRFGLQFGRADWVERGAYVKGINSGKPWWIIGMDRANRQSLKLTRG